MAFEFDKSWEDQIRGVPLPPGLAARLRQMALHEVAIDESKLDEELRRIVVPSAIHNEVRHQLRQDDDYLDAELRAVPLPPGLVERLSQEILNSGQVDPFAVEIGRSWVRPSSTIELAKAAARSILRWASVAAVWLIVVASVFSPITWRLAQILAPTAESRTEFARWEKAEELEIVEQLEQPAETWITTLPPALADAEPVGDIGIRAVSVPKASAFDELNRLLVRWRGGDGVDPMLSTIAPWWEGQLLAYREIDALPELEKMAPPTPLGMQPPLVPAFPFRELRETGIFPWLTPAAHPLLRTWHVPLVHTTESYDLARRYAAGGELPPPELVRTEDFLAALDYGLPLPSQAELRLSAAAGPSPFGGEGRWLLLLGVQAQTAKDSGHRPKHLIVILDTSSSMRWGGRAEMARRALERLLRLLTWEDRISLVSFAERAVVQFAGATRDESMAMLNLLARIPIEGPTNLASGIAAALGVAAMEDDPQRERVMLLLTDGAVEMDRATSEEMEQLLRQAAREGTRLHVIDLGQGTEEDRQLQRWARSGGGRAMKAVSRSQLEWRLAEVLSDRSQRVADDVRLSITFDPDTVRVYRFFGHEPSALRRISTSQGVEGVEFHAGQSAVGLFELQLTGNENLVAVAELSWLRRSEGRRIEQIVTVSKRDFATTVGQSAPALQAAALAARTAEILRAPRQGRSRPMLELLNVARQQFDQSLVYRPSYLELLQLIEACDRARPARTRR